MNAFAVSVLSIGISVSASAVMADAQAAIDGCIEQLPVVGGPDGQSGEVLRQEWSQAGTLVMLRDAGGTVWRCIGYDDGAVGDLSVVAAADDGGGALAGAAVQQEPETRTERVRFAKGKSGATLSGILTPGSSIRYVIGARSGQFLDVRVVASGDFMGYQIFNPDRSFLLDLMAPNAPYRGQLWQDGDHVVEVINRGSADADYKVAISIN